ncbi:Regulator of microtubule dynamics protein 1 [Acipenser ruthenus]|uniref:Regulator of microtubule dynamics protein 1 n=1 Tax=Acipenser ruthenus TaxID=7906 RepID=A0A662YW05_ACIRT|nr:Regulator of microtubule dynamics protein 1 [Acipenser ruthenus]
MRDLMTSFPAEFTQTLNLDRFCADLSRLSKVCVSMNAALQYVESAAKEYVLQIEEVIEQADYLYGSGETEKLYHLLVKYRDSDNAEFLWRLARASRDLALLSSTSAEDRKRLMYEAFDYSRNALEKNESSSAAHKWYAICISDIGDYEGTKIKIGNAYVVKEHLQRAIELNPKDATAIHVLGLWCFAFAELPWYQRKIAAMLFASPPSSTYEEALGYFLKAEEVDANFYSKNLLMLGKSYMMLKDQKSSLLWLSKAKDYPAHTEEDKQVSRSEYNQLFKKWINRQVVEAMNVCKHPKLQMVPYWNC